MPKTASTNPAAPAAIYHGRNVHLDAMRALAALCVVCTHIQQIFFVPYRQAGSGLLVKFLYIGHYAARAAVIYFFVLSGYLVGMSVLNSIHDGRWSWREYLLNRLTRLYVVLAPALLLTAALDWIGRTHPASRWAYFNDPSETGFTTVHFDTFRNFFGSLFFLQNIHTGWFGSNLPLWSLSCEFWYYIVFPVIALTILRRKRWLWCGLFLAAAGWFLGWAVVTLFPCWLAGVAAGLLARRFPIGRQMLRYSTTVAALLLLAATVIASGAHRLNFYAADYIVTIAALVLIWAALSSLLSTRTLWRPYTHAAVFLSEMSYTLYLTHMPFLLLLYRLLYRRPWPPDIRHVCLALLPFAAALVYAYGLYWLFERRTNDVRRWLKARLASERPAPLLTR